MTHCVAVFLNQLSTP